MSVKNFTLVSICFAAVFEGSCLPVLSEGFVLAPFVSDVTIPLGHRCMGILPIKAKTLETPLLAKGFVLSGNGESVVCVSVDWCEIRNEAFDRWRSELAGAAGTSPSQVLVTSVHQHDAPVMDLGAERLLQSVGLTNELCDLEFHESALQGVVRALKASLERPIPVSHYGVGLGRVEGVASNRRVALDSGRVTFDRGSSSGGDAVMREAKEGLIDPYLKTLSFWNGETPVLAWHSYATHPMSFYGRGGVNWDFVGNAREAFEAERPGLVSVYASGCSGDVTAGKYNTGSVEDRRLLGERLLEGMNRAWSNTRRFELDRLKVRVSQVNLPFIQETGFTKDELEGVLRNEGTEAPKRILAAMGLESKRRLAEGRLLEMPCLDLGQAVIVLFPGESFVGYQLMAQRMRPDVTVMAWGYGECWPGYVPTHSAYQDGFDHSWRWAGRGSEEALRKALTEVLFDREVSFSELRVREEFAQDVFAATAKFPRYSEGVVVKGGNEELWMVTTEFVGSGEDHASARLVGRRSVDGGRSWGMLEGVQENVGKRNVMSASVARFEANERSGLGLFYLVKNDWNDLKVYLRVSLDEGKTFGEAEVVTDRPGYHVMNNDRVQVLWDGRMICPVAFTQDIRTENRFVSLCFYSDDGGLSWKASGNEVSAPLRGAMEPEVVELKDGRLLMLVRTQVGEVYGSVSRDRGERWGPAAPWGITSPEAPSTCRRIPMSGELLYVGNPFVEMGKGHGGRRTPLAAMVSGDEGMSWGCWRMLETSDRETFAYTSLAFWGNQVAMGYYVRDEGTGLISNRFRMLDLVPDEAQE